MNKFSPAVVSIIIPTLNEVDHLNRALLSIGSLDLGVECIVVDGGSSDETRSIARQWPGVKLLTTKTAGRGRQMNIGAAAASGDILLFLHADCRLPAGALDRVRETCRQNKVAGGSFYLGFARQHWVLKLCSLGSRINHPWTTYGDQAQFMRREIFESINGFKEWPMMEDLEIQYRLKQHGRLIKIQQPVISSDRRYWKHGPLMHQLLNITLVVMYLCGIKPERLAKWYRPEQKETAGTSSAMKTSG